MRGDVDSSRRHILSAFCALALLPLLPGCATQRNAKGEEETRFDPKYLAKTEIDRVLDTSLEQVRETLFLLAEKFYRRNPREWRKAGFGDLESALAALRGFREKAPREIGERKEGPAALQAFAPDYPGDRVAALMYGLLTMMDAAFEYKDEFFMLDSLNAQKLYNCARNMEIAMWKLASSRDAAGQPLLLANELGETRNLSFEREFGRITGVLDLLARIVADRSGRTITRVTQSLATSFFLPVGMLK
ncbi:MAG: hypothetical protein LBB55_00615 [Zoogloeaceae bacterium]|nr:hypothetical protein [Zoogloeaceae bacterium]